MTAVDYEQYLQRRAQLANAGGFTPTHMPEHLFDFQRVLLEFAVTRGRAALFADCGMGKTPMALAWAQNVHERTGKPVLLLTPPAVGPQFVAEADKFGYEAAVSRTGDVVAPMTVSNYEQLHKFDPDDFAATVCDESSILKSFDGYTKAAVTEFMRRQPYRLLATATAAPNEYTELGTSSEALGGLGHMDMLTRFFINKDRSISSRNRVKFRVTNTANGNELGGSIKWRLKGHAEAPFWRWVSTWARAIRKPSDYGFDDAGFILPELIERIHLVEPNRARDGELFDMPAVGLREEREENRRTLEERCDRAADILADAVHGVAWCHLNDESKRLAHIIPGAVEVCGADSDQAKEEKLTAFTRGEIRVLVTKPSIGAWGLNWQHANRMTYFPSHSYEQMYQSIRRMWRFGQTQPVQVDFITTPGGRDVLANLHRKADAADLMFTALVEHMNAAVGVTPHTYDKKMVTPAWLDS